MRIFKLGITLIQFTEQDEIFYTREKKMKRNPI